MWLDKPPQTEKPDLIPLMRAKAGRSISGHLCGEPLRCWVHFACNRSWPCTNRGCSLCKRQVARRCYAYYPVCNDDGKHAIFELTAQAESQLINQMQEFSNVPCGHVQIHRAGGRRNMPCEVTWTAPTNNKQTGGNSLDENELKTHLMRIWNLPTMNGTDEETEYLEKLNEIIRLKTTKRT